MKKNFTHPLLLSLALLSLLGGVCAAGDADQDWQAILALDAGPKEQPNSADAASKMVLNHLSRQEKALRSFVGEHSQDSHAFEARLRLARLLQIRADFEGSDKPRAESRSILEQLEKTATPEQRPELEFTRVARLMRSVNPGNPGQREDALKAARVFQASYPADRRLAALFAEIATLFDSQPAKKEDILQDALRLATDEDLKARIGDDLKRVRLIGQVVPLRFTSLEDKEVKIEDLLGRPIFVIFFANFSPPSITALDRLQQEIASLPRGSVRVVGICLDERREVATGVVKGHNITWPIGCDGKSWQSPLVRDLGINALPTVWLIDAHGKLRWLNALEGAAIRAQQLLRER